MDYIGEHLLPGQIGRFALVLAFVTSLLAVVGYSFATQKRGQSDAGGWQNIGRSAFVIHGVSIFGVIGIIFYMMVNQFYEYQYVQAHVSEDLPMKYIFSAFWEGQEGSFLLWMFWHIVLGMVLIVKSKKWEAPVMAILSLIQVFIVCMIIGVYIGFGDDPIKIGSNPLLLLRDVVEAPIFTNPNYVELIQGTGLNPLLQNYWMTIHPPTLFLGFASTSIPFCFAIAGLWTGQHKEWLKPVLPWALFSGCILGLGILMGGAWAYEALTFGGYWAWDPVENMSLVPWIVLIAGIHTNLIAKNTGYSIRSTYIFYILTLVFILYSTFLTRSGILGETSVHAFTDMGLEWQLIAFVLFFLLMGIVGLVVNYKSIPGPKKEEKSSSREFWMFIGSLVLLFSALIITGSTSLPVYNKIMQFFDPDFQGRVITDPIPHYNKYQIWIAFFITILSGTAQYMRYMGTNWENQKKKFFKHMMISVLIAVGLTFVVAQIFHTRAWQYSILLFAGIFGVVANMDYLINYIKGNMKLAGSSLAHMGFGIMIVGIIASGLNQKIITSNPFLMDGLIQGADEETSKRSAFLFQNTPLQLRGYELTYISDTLDGLTRTYNIQAKKLSETGEEIESFMLTPNILYKKDFTGIAAFNPSTKRSIEKDLFSHLSALPAPEMDITLKQAQEDSLNYGQTLLRVQEPNAFLDTVPIQKPDTFMLREYRLNLLGFNQNPEHPDYEFQQGDLAFGARVAIQRSDNDSVYLVESAVVLREDFLFTYPVQINDLNTKVKLSQNILDAYFENEQALDYNTYTLQQGESFQFENFNITFESFNRQPKHPLYVSEDNDIPVGASIKIEDQSGKVYQANPLYFIRGNRPFNLKDEVLDLGLHFRFTSLNPENETLELLVAKGAPFPQEVPIDVATDSFRTDWIVIEAKEFPGINLFWLGSLLMLIGLGFGMVHRMKNT